MSTTNETGLGPRSRASTSASRQRGCFGATRWRPPTVQCGQVLPPRREKAPIRSSSLASWDRRRRQCVRRIYALRHRRCVVERVTNFTFWDSKAPVFEERRHRFREVLEASKFVLCPRGQGTSSIRLYETLASGRVPVIIADDWVARRGPDRDRCSSDGRSDSSRTCRRIWSGSRETGPRWWVPSGKPTTSGLLQTSSFTGSSRASGRSWRQVSRRGSRPRGSVAQRYRVAFEKGVAHEASPSRTQEDAERHRLDGG